jgi:Icc-related predicted phosphoesterase
MAPVMVRPTPPLLQAALALALLAGCTVGPAVEPAPSAAPSPTGGSLPAPTATPSPPPPPPPTSPPFPSPTPAPLPTPDGAITRGPYLQSPTSDSIVVVWETDRPIPGEVIFGRDGIFDQRMVSAADGLRHEVTLSGLEPGAEYSYWVASDGYPLSEGGSFRAAPTADEADFTFVAYGDTRTGHDIHRQIAESILTLKPDFAVHVGDLVAQGMYDSEWDRFFEIERALLANVPLFPCPGNHEGNDQRYFQAFVLPGNERWYSFDWGNTRIISLQIDAIMPFGTQSEQVQWLESTLAASTQEWVIVVFHIPPYDALPEDEMGYAARVNIVPVLERYGVDLVISGHNHNYQRSLVNGITYIVTGGGGAELYPIDQPDPDTEAYYNGHHFVLFNVNGGTLSGQVIAVDGKIVDEFELVTGP